MKEGYCFHCMEYRNPSESRCPICGKAQEHSEKSRHLMMGTVLNRMYLVGAVGIASLEFGDKDKR